MGNVEVSTHAATIQIVCAIITAASIGLSDLYDKSSFSGAPTFHSAWCERFCASFVLILGMVVSAVLVIVLGATEPLGLLDEKTWLWLALVYLLLRRRRTHKAMDKMARKYTELVVRLPVFHHFGFPKMSPEEGEGIELGQARKYIPIVDDNERSLEEIWPINFEDCWSKEEVEMNEDCSAPIFPKLASILSKFMPIGSMFYGVEKASIKYRNVRNTEEGSHRRYLGPCRWFSVRESFSQTTGNFLYLPQGSKTRDAQLLAGERVIEGRRKEGREQFAVACAFAFIHRLVDPNYRANQNYIMKKMVEEYKIESSLMIQNSFSANWEQLMPAARRHVNELTNVHLSGKGMVSYVAALAYSFMQGNYEPAEKMIKVSEKFWSERVEEIVQAVWTCKDPREIFHKPSLREFKRLHQVGYGYDLQAELMRKIENVLRPDAEETCSVVVPIVP